MSNSMPSIEGDPKVLLNWSEKYRLGIDAVDYEHQELIALINRLYMALSANDAKPRVSAFLGDLFKAISSHFALEEKFMSEHRYGDLLSHKTDHERLLDEIREIMDEFERTSVTDLANLSNRLDIWFSRHFQTHDAKLHRALGSNAN